MRAALDSMLDPKQWSCVPGLCFIWPPGSHHTEAEMVGKTTEANKLACGLSARKTRLDELCECGSVGLKGCGSNCIFILRK